MGRQLLFCERCHAYVNYATKRVSEDLQKDVCDVCGNVLRELDVTTNVTTNVTISDGRRITI